MTLDSRFPYFREYDLDLSVSGNKITFPCHEYSGFSVQFKLGGAGLIAVYQTNDNPDEIVNPQWFAISGYDASLDETSSTLSSPSIADFPAVGAWAKVEVVGTAAQTAKVRIFLKNTRAVVAAQLLSTTNNIGKVTVEGLEIPTHDYFSVAYPTSTREVYTYKTGGSGGTTVATVTLNYTDSTKASISDGALT